MTNISSPVIECEQIHAGLTVANLAAAIEFYTQKLGFRLGFTWGGEPPTFAGVNLGKTQIFLKVGTPAPNAEISSVFFVMGVRMSCTSFIRLMAWRWWRRLTTGTMGFAIMQ